MPTRTCIGCRRPDRQDGLVRLVWAGDRLALDPARTAPGRGAYLHHDPECWRQAVRRRAVARALRLTPEQSARARLDELAPPQPAD